MTPTLWTVSSSQILLSLALRQNRSVAQESFKCCFPVHIGTLLGPLPRRRAPVLPFQAAVNEDTGVTYAPTLPYSPTAPAAETARHTRMHPCKPQSFSEETPTSSEQQAALIVFRHAGNPPSKQPNTTNVPPGAPRTTAYPPLKPLDRRFTTRLSRVK